MCAIRAWKATSTPRAPDKSYGGGGGLGSIPTLVEPAPGKPRAGFFILFSADDADFHRLERGNSVGWRRSAGNPMGDVPGPPILLIHLRKSADQLFFPGLCLRAKARGRYPLAGQGRGTACLNQKGSSGMSFIRSARWVSCTSFLARFGSKPTRRLTMPVTSSGRLA